RRLCSRFMTRYAAASTRSQSVDRINTPKDGYVMSPSIWWGLSPPSMCTVPVWSFSESHAVVHSRLRTSVSHNSFKCSCIILYPPVNLSHNSSAIFWNDSSDPLTAFSRYFRPGVYPRHFTLCLFWVRSPHPPIHSCIFTAYGRFEPSVKKYVPLVCMTGDDRMLLVRSFSSTGVSFFAPRSGTDLKRFSYLVRCRFSVCA